MKKLYYYNQLKKTLVIINYKDSNKDVKFKERSSKSLI